MSDNCSGHWYRSKLPWGTYSTFTYPCAHLNSHHSFWSWAHPVLTVLTTRFPLVFSGSQEGANSSFQRCVSGPILDDLIIDRKMYWTRSRCYQSKGLLRQRSVLFKTQKIPTLKYWERNSSYSLFLPKPFSFHPSPLCTNKNGWFGSFSRSWRWGLVVEHQ